MTNELQQFSFGDVVEGIGATWDEANAKWQDLEYDPEGRLEWEQAENERKTQWLEQFADTMI